MGAWVCGCEALATSLPDLGFLICGRETVLVTTRSCYGGQIFHETLFCQHQDAVQHNAESVLTCGSVIQESFFLWGHPHKVGLGSCCRHDGEAIEAPSYAPVRLLLRGAGGSARKIR